MIRPFIAAAILCAVLGSSSARAENKEVARAAFGDGTRLCDIADFNGAPAAFKKAYLNYEEPSFLFNIAQCYRQLGNKPEAIRFYRTYLRKAPAAVNAEEVRQVIAALEKSLADEKTATNAPPVGTIVPDTPPPRADTVHDSGATRVESNPLVVATPPPPHKSVYKKWWFWTATIGGAAVAAAAVGVGLTLGQPRESSVLVHAP